MDVDWEMGEGVFVQKREKMASLLTHPPLNTLLKHATSKNKTVFSEENSKKLTFKQISITKVIVSLISLTVESCLIEIKVTIFYGYLIKKQN
jgi:hypothetical protein